MDEQRDEEARARIKAYADATGVTMTQVNEGWKRLAESLRAASFSMSELRVRRGEPV